MDDRATFPLRGCCPVHGSYSAEAWPCPKCWTPAGALRPRLPLRNAPADWWAHYHAQIQHFPSFMARCPSHGFTEHRTHTGHCSLCDLQAPVRLRPP